MEIRKNICIYYEKNKNVLVKILLLQALLWISNRILEIKFLFKYKLLKKCLFIL